MKLIKILALTFSAVVIVACAPRDTTHYLSIQEALSSPEAKKVLNPKIKLYFGKPAPGSSDSKRGGYQPENECCE